MAKLKQPPTLREIQSYVRDMCQERGWDKDSYLVKMLLLTEELGELAKAMRHQAKIYPEPAKRKTPRILADEFADVLSYVCDLANYFDVDLEQAFRAKESRNRKRTWKK